MVASSKSNALRLLAESLSEDILRTPANALIVEAAEDHRDHRALTGDFDRIFRRSVTRVRRQALSRRLPRALTQIAAWAAPQFAMTSVGTLAIAVVAGALYLDRPFAPTEPNKSQVMVPAAIVAHSQTPSPSGAPTFGHEHLAAERAQAALSMNAQRAELERAAAAHRALQQTPMAVPSLTDRLVSGSPGEVATLSAGEVSDVSEQLAVARALAHKATAADHAQAFRIFKRIAEQHWNDGLDSHQAHETARAVVALAEYFLSGIPAAPSPPVASEKAETSNDYAAIGATHASSIVIRQDAQEASALLRHAATRFADPDAQYELARLYVDGKGVAKDPEEAMRWFVAAAEQGLPRAQAAFGAMLVKGQGAPKDVSRGLSWLTLAKDAAGPDEGWIRDAYATAYAQADAEQRKRAQASAIEWAQRHRR
jgi:uncharacterized protein